MDVDTSVPEEGVAGKAKMDELNSSSTVQQLPSKVSEIPSGLAPLAGPSMELRINTENPSPVDTGLLMIATTQGANYTGGGGDWNTNRLDSGTNSQGLLGLLTLADISPPRSISGRSLFTNAEFPKYNAEDPRLNSVSEETDDGFFWDQPAPPSYQDLFKKPTSMKSENGLNFMLEKAAGGNDVDNAIVDGGLSFGCLADSYLANEETLFTQFEGVFNDIAVPPPSGFESDDLTSEVLLSEGVMEKEFALNARKDLFNVDALVESLADLTKDVPTETSFNSRFGKYEQDLAGLVPEDVFQRAYDPDLFELTDSSEDELDSVRVRGRRLFSEEEYGNYCVSDTDSGDLTEVTPMSSLAPSPLPNEETIADLSGPSSSSKGPSPSKTGLRLKNEWLQAETAQAPQEGAWLNGTVPTFSFDSGMEDGSPLPPQESSRRSSESGRGSYMPVTRQKRSHTGRRSQSLGNGSTPTSTRDGKVRLRVPRVPTSGRKAVLRANRSFNAEQAQRIERDNQILLGRLVETAQQPRTPYGSSGSTSSQSGRAKHVAPASISRQRNIRRIDLENQFLLKRLRIVKASREITDNFSNSKPRATLPKKTPTTGDPTSHGTASN